MKNWQQIFFKSKDFFLSYPKSSLFLLVLLVFLFGYWQGRIVTRKIFLEEKGEIVQLRQQSGYHFINPLLECENFSEGNFLRSKELEKNVRGVIEDATTDNKVVHISVYFRDLNNGPWMGFNEDEKFTPASLLKVPIMMAYLKKEEQEPGFLSRRVIFRKDPLASKNQPEPNIKPSKKLENNAEYTLWQIVESLIIFSDNDSATFLLEKIDPLFLEKVYADLMLPVPGKDGSWENFMTVKEYASFFRILYNASYLNREMSEKALELLSRVEFEKGVVAGVPEGTVVAHKFGERRENNLVQLHDCGVVYNKSKPYLLCVMSRGNDFGELESAIRDISQKIWEEVAKK